MEVPSLGTIEGGELCRINSSTIIVSTLSEDTNKTVSPFLYGDIQLRSSLFNVYTAEYWHDNTKNILNTNENAFVLILFLLFRLGKVI